MQCDELKSQELCVRCDVPEHIIDDVDSYCESHLPARSGVVNPVKMTRKEQVAQAKRPAVARRLSDLEK